MTNETWGHYSPQEIESKIYDLWLEHKTFEGSEGSDKPPFCIILPPPNVTGFLHIGHALNHTIQDTLARWKRMNGFNVLFVPGSDHAGISTQTVVEKALAKEGLRRQDLGRKKFLERVFQWKEEFENRIKSQMKTLGNSCDWSRYVFTLDPEVSKAVRKVFVEFYKKGWIYKSTRLINWSPALESAISDLEVEHKDVKGHLWHIAYPLADGDGQLVVATTRPETLLGDTAVCVHPDDERYKNIIGKEVKLPLTNRTIKVIADTYVDSSFGSGVVKITPAHDFNDYEIGKRHKLEFINILNINGTLNASAGDYEGLSVNEARKKIVQDLEDQNLLIKVEDHQHSVAHCNRTHCVAEPFLSDQWFLNTAELSIPAKRVVENGSIEFHPKNLVKTYLHWMNNIQDWCISRQLWWGHQIPVWYCKSCEHINVSEEEPKACSECSSKDLVQDPDVLDTWFSSALWPFSTLGWPKQTKLLENFYPTQHLVTGPDIIFFWVARMIMMGLEFQKDIPFRKVYFNGLIRDSQGRKMSKSLNNSIDPLDAIEQYGCDALRFYLISQTHPGRDLKFSVKKLEGSRNFMNKIWNASRFTMNALEDYDKSQPDLKKLNFINQWILSKLKTCVSQVNDSLSQLQFYEASNSAYHFCWNEFCDWYLELIKPIIYSDDKEAKTETQYVLSQVFEHMLTLLHPFAPFITETIFQKNSQGEVLALKEFPTLENTKELFSTLSEEDTETMDFILKIITSVRNIRGENNIKHGDKLTLYLNTKNETLKNSLQGLNEKAILNLGGLKDLRIEAPKSLSKCAVSLLQSESYEAQIVVPLEGFVEFEKEIIRLKKNIEKLNKEKKDIKNRLSNKDFVSNAPEDIVVKNQERISDIEKELLRTEESLVLFTS